MTDSIKHVVETDNRDMSTTILTLNDGVKVEVNPRELFLNAQENAGISEMSSQDKLVEEIVQFVSDHTESNSFARIKALAISDTRDWTPKDWERNEDTEQYTLYYSELTRIKAKLVTLALNQLLGA